MRKPVVDYREFRLSRLDEPRFEHLKLLGGWLIYLVLYFITENLIPVSRCHVIHCALDDLVGSLLYFLLYDLRSFRRLQIYIMITQAVAMLTYIVYPSIQLGRPEVFERDNLLTRLAAFIYSFDTPTGVCPSLHVAYSLGIASVWCRARDGNGAWKAFMIFSAVMISISTAFVKQHSVVDIAAAIPVGLLAELQVFGKTRLNRWIEGKWNP